MLIYEEHYCRGCYHYYNDNLKVYFSALYTNKRDARHRLMKRYPELSQYKIKYISK